VIDGLKPYPKYKDSGVPWLGEVPEHWEVARNGRLFAERREVGFPGLLVLEVSLRTGVRVRNGDSGARKQALGDLATYKRARAGDIAYNMMRMWQGAVGVAPVDGLVSPAYVVARPFAEADSRYYEYLFRTPAYMGEVNNYSRGIVADRNRLYWDEFKDVRSPVPPRDEQVVIVGFLRALNRRIAHYVRAKMELITLLNEQRQAIIHHAVTQGIDVNVRLKRTDARWLQTVPEQWQMLPLKRVAWVKSGAGFPLIEQGHSNQELPFVKVSDMNNSRSAWIENTESSIARETAARLGAYVFPAGTIVFPKVGGALLTNKRRVLAKPSCIDNNVMGCVADGADRDYILLVLQHVDLGRMAKPGPVPAISEGDVSEIKIPLPPHDEQLRLVQHLTLSTTTIDRAAVVAEDEIRRFHELRLRLTSDVVTGKLDVGEAAARLPIDEAADEFPEIGDTDKELGDESDAEAEVVEGED
jgi:type I restriction enzyme S subunit